MKKTFQIEIESSGNYDFENTFKKKVVMTEEEFLSLANNVLEFLKLNNIKDWEEIKVAKPSVMINFLQQVGETHCLMCHKNIKGDFSLHWKRKHSYSDVATPCTEKCGKWFSKETNNQIEKIQEPKKGEAWRKGYSAGFDEAMKACGGCKECYGKGYATTLAWASGRGEWDIGQGGIEINERLPIMRFCTCDRGKQLKKLIQLEYEKNA